MSLPLLVKSNTVLPIGAQSDRPDYDFVDDVTLRIYALDDERTVTTRIPNLNGEAKTTFTISRNGSTYTIQRDGSGKNWRVILMGATSIADIKDATVIKSPEGVLVKLGTSISAVKLESLE
jgi:alpha-D-xyloside xylohydrolase